MNTIAFFCDKNMIPGFHAALSSLLINNIIENPLRIILFSDKLSLKDKELVFRTFNKLKKEHQQLEIREAPYMKISGANALVGNFTTYGRLFLSDLLKDTDTVLYLDSDIIVNMDVNDIFEQMKGDYMLFVSGVGERAWSLDNKLYKKANLAMNGLCFNAGILGINLKKWRLQKAFEQCINTINKFPNEFLSADQAVLNVTFHNDFKVLPKNINIGALNNYSCIQEKGIYHFIGIPKPWHPFMKKYHENYHLWKYYVNLSSLKFTSLKFLNLASLLRLSKSYYRLFYTHHAS